MSRTSTSLGGRRLQPFFEEVLLNLVNVLVVVFLYPPLVLLLLLPLWLYRCLAQRLAAAREPRLGAILSGLSASYAAPSRYNVPGAVLHPNYIFGESLSLDHISSVFNERVLSKRNPSGGGYTYLLMRQRVVARYGYNFWADEEEPTFQAHHHFRYLNPSNPHQRVKYSELMAINQRLSEEPLPPSRSPWEVVLIPNVEKEGDPSVKCVVILRIHHCLADGYSIINLMGALSFTPWEDFRAKAAKKSSATVEASQLSSFLAPLTATLRAPYHVAKFMHFHTDQNAWVSRAWTESKGTVRLTWAEPIPLAEVKAVAAHHRVSVSSVIIMLLVGAIESGMRRSGDAIPSKMQIAVPWPLPGHPGVGNHHTGATIRFRIVPGEPLETLRGIDAAYSAVKRSSLPLASHYLGLVIATLPANWIPFGIPNHAPPPVTSSLSNMPVSTHTIDMFGSELKGCRLGVWMMPRFAPVAYCVTYGGQLEYMTGADCAIFPQEEDILQFAASFRDTLNSLQAEETA